jgi:hypothetical protein
LILWWLRFLSVFGSAQHLDDFVQMLREELMAALLGIMMLELWM